MPRSGWIAVGAVLAATFGARVGIVPVGGSRGGHRGAGVAGGRAVVRPPAARSVRRGGPRRAGHRHPDPHAAGPGASTRRHRGRWPVVRPCRVGRLATGRRPGRGPGDRAGNGWPRRLAEPDRHDGAPRRDPPPLPARRARRPRRGRGPCPTATRFRLRPLPGAHRRVGHAPGRDRPPRRRRGRGAGSDAGATATRSRRCAGHRPARTRGRARVRHPHRPSRPGRSRAGGGLHDRRRQPRRGHLGLEHRHRRGRDRGRGGTGRSTASGHRDRPGGHRLHRLRGRIAIRAPGRGHGRRRAPGPGEWPCRPGGRRARLGGGAPAAGRPEPHRRCRIPAVVAGHGRLDRLGDTADRAARAACRRACAALAGRESRACRSPPRRRRCRWSWRRSVVLPSSRRWSTCSSCPSWPRPWPSAWSPWLAAGWSWPVPRRSSGPCWPCPAGSACGSWPASSASPRTCPGRASPSTARPPGSSAAGGTLAGIGVVVLGGGAAVPARVRGRRLCPGSPRPRPHLPRPHVPRGSVARLGAPVKAPAEHGAWPPWRWSACWPSPRPSSSHDRPASPGSRSSMSDRATRSWSRAGMVVACSSMAGPTPTGCSSSSTGWCRRGTGASMSWCCRTPMRTTSPAWPCSSTATGSVACTSRACSGRVPATRPGRIVSLATVPRARAGLGGRRPAAPGRHRPARPVADPRRGAPPAARRRDGHQQRLDRVPRARSARGGSC